MTVPISDGTDVAIVAYLRTKSSELTRAAPAIEFVAATWRRYLGDIRSEVASVCTELNGSVSHEDLEKLAIEATNPVGRQRLFVASLMWGRGKRNARMLPGFIEALTATQLDNALRGTQRSIHRGRPAEAYDEWTDANIPGLGEAFFTKWFWAAGLHGVPPECLRPLVLDSRVWKSLRALGWSSETTTGRRYRTQPSAAYGAYLAAARRWSQWLCVDGLDIGPDRSSSSFSAAKCSHDAIDRVELGPHESIEHTGIGHDDSSWRTIRPRAATSAA